MALKLKCPMGVGMIRSMKETFEYKTVVSGSDWGKPEKTCLTEKLIFSSN